MRGVNGTFEEGTISLQDVALHVVITFFETLDQKASVLLIHISEFVRTGANKSIYQLDGGSAYLP